jgi:hypothetical protein
VPQNQDQLAAVLKYHVVSGNIPSSEVSTGTVETLNGEFIAISVTEAGVKINDAATVVQPDVLANNGIIHVIDAVLLPQLGVGTTPPTPSPVSTPLTTDSPVVVITPGTDSPVVAIPPVTDAPVVATPPVTDAPVASTSPTTDAPASATPPSAASPVTAPTPEKGSSVWTADYGSKSSKSKTKEESLFSKAHKSYKDPQAKVAKSTLHDEEHSRDESISDTKSGKALLLQDAKAEKLTQSFTSKSTKKSEQSSEYNSKVGGESDKSDTRTSKSSKAFGKGSKQLFPKSHKVRG